MKLQQEYEITKSKIAAIKTQIIEYIPKLKESGQYNNFETRLAFDVLRVIYPSSVICDWYGKYDCNDKHIETLIKRCLKDLNLI